MTQLVVLGEDGNVRVVGAGGDVDAELTADAGGDIGYHQPTWMSDGAHVVWSRSEGGTAGRLEIATADGKSRWSTEGGFVPFYLYPSPDGRRVAQLSEGPLGLELSVVDRDMGTSELLARGVPLYWSWAPDGRRLVAHIGDEVVLLSLDGTTQIVDGQAGAFLAPWWDVSEELVYVTRRGDRQQLVVASGSGEVHTVVTEFEGVARFVVDPAGRRVAYSTGNNGPGPVTVADLVTGTRSEVVGAPVIGFWWSPDSCRLLALRIVEGVPHRWAQWWLWEGDGARPLGRLVPTATFTRAVLPFFEQFAQSHRLWAPDSSVFTYAGLSDSGRTGIWVQAVDGGEPYHLADGVSAWWSPI